MTWKLTPLKKITTKIGSGATPRGGKNSYKTEGITLIRSLNVYDFEFSYEGLAFITEEQASETRLARVIVNPKDILLNITGASVARCCVVPEHLLPARVNQHVSLVRVDSNRADSRYVLYCINSPAYKHQLLVLAQGGTTREALTKEIIGNFEIPLPPLPTQRKIAAVLSAYDDLIENNTRRIKILEEMAGAIYREWFVEFRFPGHEGVEMVESELGLIPQGWVIARMSDIADLSREGIRPSQCPKEVFAHFSIPAFDSGCMPVFDSGDAIRSNKYLVPRNCVLISKLNPKIPRVWFPSLNTMHRAIASTEFLILTPKPSVNRVFLFNLCRSAEFSDNLAVRALGTSGSHQRVSPTDFLNLSVLVPPESFLNSFYEKIGPMIQICNTLRLKNTNLRQTRDLLLPKLISGEIDVSKLNLYTDENMEINDG